MNWAVYLIAGLTLTALVISLVLRFCYGNTAAPRWQLIASDCTVLMLCVSILSGGKS